MLRSRIASAVALTLSAAVTSPLIAADPAHEAAIRVAGSFVQALQSDDPATFGKLPLAERAYWRVVRDFFNAMRCVTIEGTAVSLEPAGDSVMRIRVHVDGHAEDAGPPHERKRIPAEWILEVRVRDGRHEIDYAGTLENHLAREIAAGRSAETPDAASARRDVHPVRFAKELAYEAAEPQFGERALPLIAAARAIAAPLGEPHAEAFIIEMLGTQQRFLGLNEAAVKTGDESLALAMALGIPDAISGALFTRGLAQWAAGDVAAAIAGFEQAASYVDRVRSPPRTLFARHMANHLHAIRGDIRSAVAGAQKLLEESARWNWAEGTAMASFTLGEAHFTLNNYSVARRYFLAALAHFESTGEQDQIVTAQFDLALCDAKLGRTSDTEARLRRALARGQALGGHHRATIQLRLAETLLLRGELSQAEQVLRDARIDAAEAPDGRIMSDLAIAEGELALLVNEPERALEASREAAAAHVQPSSIGTYWSPWPIASLAGKALARLKKHEEAVAQFDEAIGIIEAEWTALPTDEIAKTSYLEERMEPYYGLFDSLLALDRTEDALMAAERMRTRVLREALEAERVDVRSHMTAAQVEQERSLRRRTVELNRLALAAGNAAEESARRKELSAAREELRTFIADRYVSSSEGRALQLELPRDLLASLQIPAGAAVVEYVVRDTRTIAFVITRRGDRTKVTMRAIPVGGRRLEELAKRYHAAIAGEDLSFDESGRKLYEVLLAPLDELLRPFRTICIIPDGVLWQVPFQALRSGAGVYVIERASVFVSPSLAMLAESSRKIGQRRGEPRSVLAMAGAPGARDAALRQAETEVRRIARLYDEERRTVFVGKDATERALKQQTAHYSVLHVASHGQVDSTSPRYSSVALGAGSRDSEDDGVLELQEIADLRLNADLVVLSACETGRGELRSGEGPISLAWAFLAAGCPATVVSQWQVSSLAASDLMVEFHRQLLSGGTNAGALREAGLRLMRTAGRKHPYYWAPFVVVGAGW